MQSVDPQPDSVEEAAAGNLLVQMRGISKHFGGLQALRNVNFEIRQGEVLGLVGDNGAGKSTLMKILTGAYHPDEGSIHFNGRPVQLHRPQDSRNLGIEMIYQNLALCPNRNVTANIFLGRERAKFSLFGFLKVLDWPEMRKQAIHILESLHITIKSLDVPVEKLSGGQQQAVAIGRAVSFDPQLVIMDEPTASLALKEVESVLELIRNLRKRGISVIIISHRLQDVFSVADRIGVLRAGELVEIYNIPQVSPDEVVRAMFLGRN